MLIPKLFTTLKTYSLKLFAADLVAGTVVGIVALPLAIAFAIASGVTPDKGLITGVVAGFMISAFGGSRFQIGGPTGAFVVIVSGIIGKYGLDGLIVATLMAGLILIIMGLVKLGALIKYIPYPIIVGFTSGIAVIIFSTQIKDFFGLTAGDVPSGFVEKWIFYARNITHFSWPSLVTGILSLAVLFIWPRFSKKIPASLIVIVGATLAASLLNLEVATIESKFGAIPAGLPAPVMPRLSLDMIRNLISPALTIALLAAIESLLSAVVADGMTGTKHRSNIELMAQGLANIASGLFGGIPATGAIARTATNIKNGAKTPVAGIVHAVVLLFIMLLFGHWAGKIPLCALAAILIYVAYHMAEIDAFNQVLRRSPRGDILALLVTFFLTVLVDLTVAIEVGMVLTAFTFMKRMADTTGVKAVHAPDESEGDETEERPVLPPDVDVFEINGPFFFGSVDKFHDTISLYGRKPAVIILRMRHVPYMDTGGTRAIDEMINKCHKAHIVLKITELQKQPARVFEKSGLAEQVGRDRIYGDFRAALG